MARTLTGNNPRREQRVQEIILDRLVLRYRGRITSEIRRAMRAAASGIARGDALPVDAAMSVHRENMTRILTRLWTESGRDMAEHIDPTKAARDVRQFKQVFEGVEAEIVPTEIADRVMSDWIRTVGGQKITQITETTRENIQSVIAAGINNGLSEREIAKSIRDIAPGIAGSRSDTISRTETHAAANVSAVATAKATGLNLVREWSASSGERTRKAHREADGQKVGMNEPFIVDNEPLMYPGDPNGRASNVINCRCAVLYVLR